jgi:hypothetical protein
MREGREFESRRSRNFKKGLVIAGPFFIFGFGCQKPTARNRYPEVLNLELLNPEPLGLFCVFK